MQSLATGLWLTILLGINVQSFVLNDGPTGECEDHVNIDCTSFTNQFLCTSPHLLKYAADHCPRHCNFCTPCIDIDDRCPGLLKYCYLPYIAANCSRACKACDVFNPDEFVQNLTASSATTTLATVVTTSAISTTLLPPKTSLATQPTPNPFLTKDCDKLGIIVEVAKENSVSYPGLRSCLDGTHQPSEALIHTFCGAPDMSNWTQGVKVLENCQRIPHYTPIAAVTSVFGGSTVAGVFVKCETGGFQAAIQTCQSELKIFHVSNSSTSGIPTADKFVVLNW